MEKLRNRTIIQEFHPFYHCCRDAANDVVEMEAELDELMKETKDREMTGEESQLSLLLQHHLHMREVSAPIFGVIAAESFIHTYAANTFGFKLKYSIEHIDKLDTYSKWIVIPALSCGSEIDKTSSAMNDFRQLIKIRNSIVHSKPTILNNIDGDRLVNASQKNENMSKARRQIAKKSPDIFIGIVRELVKIDKKVELVDLIMNMALPFSREELAKLK